MGLKKSERDALGVICRIGSKERMTGCIGTQKIWGKGKGGTVTGKGIKEFRRMRDGLEKAEQFLVARAKFRTEVHQTGWNNTSEKR